jgi:xeroderma pigmentosum group C-complementing protein
MLSEAGVATAVSSSPERPLKKPRRGGAKYAPASREDDVSLHASKLQQTRGLSVDKEVENLAPEDAIAVPNATVQTMQLDTDEDDEDEDVEFEDVDFNAWLEGKDTAEPEAMALELNLSAQKTSMTPSKKGPERRKPLTREEREKRTHIHQTHLLCLLSHVALRNHWCNDDKVQGYLRRHLSDKIITYLTPGANLSQFGRTESLKNGLTQAFALWKTKFEVVERGLRRSLWAEEEGHLENVCEGICNRIFAH